MIYKFNNNATVFKTKLFWHKIVQVQEYIDI